MSLRTASLLFLIAFVFVFPSRAFAQLSIPGKMMTYRTLDLDSREVLQQSRSWQILDAHSAWELTATTYLVGNEVVSECGFANGFARPATTFRSIMRSATGELERSDFDTFDPRYYPFLAGPIAGGMQPGSLRDAAAAMVPRLAKPGRHWHTRAPALRSS